MSILEIMTIVVCVLIVVGVIGLSIYRKKKGKPSCCSDCASCKYNRQCCKCNGGQYQKEDIPALLKEYGITPKQDLPSESLPQEPPEEQQ